MSPEKQRIAIATACGWTDDSWCLTPSGWVFADTVPDYLNDKNAMHEAKKVLTDDQSWEMVKFIVDYRQPATGFPLLSRSETLMLNSVTAEQEAEAFLKTLELWEEEQ